MSYQIIDTIKAKMDKVLIHLEDELKGIRTGQANANMLDGIEVSYYGTMTPVKQIASVTIQEGRIFVIKPFDSNSLKDVEKALNVADLGITPQNDGTVIRLNVPKLTEETRKEMVKKVNKIAEEEKIAIRNIRRDANDATKKDKELPEDVSKDTINEIQKVTDIYIKKIDEIAAVKEKEVMKV
mgnify:CR=1 FL=1